MTLVCQIALPLKFEITQGAHNNYRCARYAIDMMLRPQTEQAVCKAFWVALLLLADARDAEAAVMDAIECLDFDDFTGDTLLASVLELAIQPSRRFYRQDVQGRTASLPTFALEFSAILQLPTLQRQCFVLRVVLRVPDEASARLLRVSRRELVEVYEAALSALVAQSSTENKTESPHSPLCSEVSERAEAGPIANA